MLEVNNIVFLAHVIDGDDVGMIQPTRCFGFLLEAFDEFIAARSVAVNRDGLQRYGTPDALVISFVDCSAIAPRPSSSWMW